MATAAHFIRQTPSLLPLKAIILLLFRVCSKLSFIVDSPIFKIGLIVVCTEWFSSTTVGSSSIKNRLSVLASTKL